MAETKEAEKQEKKPKDREFTIAKGSMIVGKNELRPFGATVKASELPAEQLEYFLSDGTLTAK